MLHSSPRQISDLALLVRKACSETNEPEASGLSNISTDGEDTNYTTVNSVRPGRGLQPESVVSTKSSTTTFSRDAMNEGDNRDRDGRAGEVAPLNQIQGDAYVAQGLDALRVSMQGLTEGFQGFQQDLVMAAASDNGPGSSSGQTACFNCEQPGHWARECPARFANYGGRGRGRGRGGGSFGGGRAQGRGGFGAYGRPPFGGSSRGRGGRSHPYTGRSESNQTPLGRRSADTPSQSTLAMPSNACRRFWSNGDCNYGARCRFKHVVQTACRNFARGACDRGEECRFVHVHDSQEAKQEPGQATSDNVVASLAAIAADLRQLSSRASDGNGPVIHPDRQQFANLRAGEGLLGRRDQGQSLNR